MIERRADERYNEFVGIALHGFCFKQSNLLYPDSIQVQSTEPVLLSAPVRQFRQTEKQSGFNVLSRKAKVVDMIDKQARGDNPERGGLC